MCVRLENNGIQEELTPYQKQIVELIQRTREFASDKQFLIGTNIDKNMELWSRTSPFHKRYPELVEEIGLPKNFLEFDLKREVLDAVYNQDLYLAILLERLIKDCAHNLFFHNADFFRLEYKILFRILAKYSKLESLIHPPDLLYFFEDFYEAFDSEEGLNKPIPRKTRRQWLSALDKVYKADYRSSIEDEDIE